MLLNEKTSSKLAASELTRFDSKQKRYEHRGT